MIKEYTVDVHVERLERMLEMYKTCGMQYCPASVGYRVRDGFPVKWEKKGDTRVATNWHPLCRVCRKFIRMRQEGCPCLVYGSKQAIEKSEAALARYYNRLSE